MIRTTIGLLVIGMSSGHLECADRVGVVDTQKVIMSCKMTQERMKSVGEFPAAQKEMGRLKDLISKMEKEKEKDAPGVTPQIKADRAAQADRARKELGAFEAQLASRTGDEQRMIIRSMTERVILLIGEEGRRGKFSMIVDAGAVPFWNKGVDLTDKLIESCNATGDNSNISPPGLRGGVGGGGGK